MSYKVLYYTPNAIDQLSSVTLNIGEKKIVKDYSVEIYKVIDEPTESKTGSALVTITFSNGVSRTDMCALAKNGRGGFRDGAGRPKGERTKVVTIKLSEAALLKLNSVTKNKSEYIDTLILQQ